SRGSRADIRFAGTRGGPDNDGNLANRPDGARLSAAHGRDVRARRPDRVVDGLVEVRAPFSLEPARTQPRRAVRMADHRVRLFSRRGKLSQCNDRVARRRGDLSQTGILLPHVPPDASYRVERNIRGRASQGSGCPELQGLVCPRLAAPNHGWPIGPGGARPPGPPAAARTPSA